MDIHEYFVNLNRISEKYKTDLKTLEKQWEETNHTPSPTLKQKLIYLLKKAIGTNDVHIHQYPDGHISGYVISESFEKESEELRMKRIWNHLNNFLFEDEIKKIIYLTTYSRTEWKEEVERIE